MSSREGERGERERAGFTARSLLPTPVNQNLYPRAPAPHTSQHSPKTSHPKHTNNHPTNNYNTRQTHTLKHYISGPTTQNLDSQKIFDLFINPTTNSEPGPLLSPTNTETMSMLHDMESE
ncbi:hypothetical protein FHG87_010553 [Trinorchestia longiramus]|nr:hypothetical protein FHG87_010553 [Trinorchestia longiramus]